MSLDFSAITPLNTSTISRAPAYSRTAQAPAASQAVASSPMDAYGYPQKKKSHWFLKTLATVVVLGGAAAILRKKVDMFKNFDLAAKLPDDAKAMDKVKHYGKKAVAYVGEQINKGVEYVLNFFKRNKDKVETPPAAPATPAATTPPAPAAPAP